MIPKRIMVIGSSSAEGKVDPLYGGFAGRLRAWHEGFDQHNHVFNLGVSGDTTAEILARLLPEAQARKPQLILVQHGLNDTARKGGNQASPRIGIDGFKSNVEEIITQARSIADAAFISVYPLDDRRTSPVAWADKYYLLDDAKRYSTAAKDICAHRQVPYLDIFSQWMERDYMDYLHTDGLHANARGHELIFNALEEFLTQLYS
jgi:lysophospholipase L1-like esterase